MTREEKAKRVEEVARDFIACFDRRRLSWPDLGLAHDFEALRAALALPVEEPAAVRYDRLLSEADDAWRAMTDEERAGQNTKRIKAPEETVTLREEPPQGGTCACRGSIRDGAHGLHSCTELRRNAMGEIVTPLPGGDPQRIIYAAGWSPAGNGGGR